MLRHVLHMLGDVAEATQLDLLLRPVVLLAFLTKLRFCLRVPMSSESVLQKLSLNGRWHRKEGDLVVSDRFHFFCCKLAAQIGR